MSNQPHPTADQPSRSLTGENDFERLLALAGKGDQAAITQIVERLRPYLLLIANQDLDKNLQAKLGPSDLVQSALIAAQQNFAQFDGTTLEALQGWVKKILHNNLVDARRRFQKAAGRKTDREVSIDDSEVVAAPPIDQFETPRAMFTHTEQQQLLEQAISRLPENYQQVIKMRNWNELGFREIGQQMGLSDEAARKLWARAIVRLQTVIKSEFPTLE